MGRSQRGETIVGISDDYKEKMPNAPQRGPSKTPMKAKMEAMEAENISLKGTLSEMQMMMLKMKETMEGMQQQQAAQSLMGTPEKPSKKG